MPDNDNVERAEAERIVHNFRNGYAKSEHGYDKYKALTDAIAAAFLARPCATPVGEERGGICAWCGDFTPASDPQMAEKIVGHMATCEKRPKQTPPPDGHVLDDKGVVRKVLGTLPLTADGCVIGSEGVVWREDANWKAMGRPRFYEKALYTAYVRDTSPCYSTLEVATRAGGST